VHWFDIDQPAVMQLKQQLLQQASAQVTPPSCSTTAASIRDTPASQHTPTAAADKSDHICAHAAATVNQASQQQQQQQQQAEVQFPLLLQQWRPLPVDLSEVPLAACLQAAGFQQQRPTVWLAEALLYYLPLDTVSSRLSSYASACAVCDVAECACSAAMFPQWQSH
jgi:O-methyltransferase involved in polyketide biosynthesis